MSLSERINRIWSSSAYEAPVVPLTYYDNEVFATIEDTGLLWRFMGHDGQVYTALASHCKTIPSYDAALGVNVHTCADMTVIMCSPAPGIENARDVFVLNNIAPLLI